MPDLASELTDRALAVPRLVVIEHRSHDRAYKACSLAVYDATSGIGPSTEAITLGWISTPYSRGWQLMGVHHRPHGELRAKPVLAPATPDSAVADFFSRMETP